MKRSDFLRKESRYTDDAKELERKYQRHLREQEESMILKALATQAAAKSVAGVGALGPLVDPNGSGAITFNGTNAYVRVPNATLSTWEPGTNDFTVEFFMKQTGTGSGFPRVFSIGPDTTATLGMSIESGPTLYVWADNGTGAGQWMNGSMPNDFNPNGAAARWIHIALSRTTGITRLYIDGSYKSKSSSVRKIDNTVNAGQPMYMGGDGASNWWKGNLTNFRWVNSSLYTSETTITIPTSPLTVIANTKLLLLGGSAANPVFDVTNINTLVNSNTGWDSDTPFA